MIKIWVDDARPAPTGYNHFITVDEVINFISHINTSWIEELNLDYDAGDYTRILDWLECMNISIPIVIHSMNITDAKNMMQIYEKNNWNCSYSLI